MQIIDARTLVTNFDLPIKISAGPGAGKTEWLINHLKNVLNNSTRLKISRKVACITYTNVAVETIQRRLEGSAHQAEISTIHSFLYKHVLKPYIHFIATDYNINFRLIRGHDDKIITSYQFIQEWKTRTKQVRIRDDEPIREAFSRMKWTFDSNGELKINTPWPISAGGYNIKTSSYMDYKVMAWERGIIHHDDVLFLSFQLLKKFPFILEVLRAKFPYFFVDEFQDISPIQLQILNLIILKETTVCVIGDSAQSIYNFTGASPSQFENFTTPHLQEYQIKDNWRSTDGIVSLLNLIRPALPQIGMRQIPGTGPVIIVGDKTAALAQLSLDTNSSDICTLSYLSLTANSMRKNVTGTAGIDLINSLYNIDGNSTRKRTIIRAIKAVEFANQGYFKDALKEVSKIVDDPNENTSNKKSLVLLKSLLDNQPSYINGNLLDLYVFINGNIKSLSRFSGANPQTFYTTNSYQAVSLAVKLLNESFPFKTIHKSKGDQFDAVFLILEADKNGVFDEIKELEFILKPDLTNEDHRINYVAVSRARNHLYINVPNLSQSTALQLIAKGFTIK